MNKKYLLIGSILVVLIVAVWLFFNLGITCRDGQGSTIYLPKNTLLKNLESATESEIGNYYISSVISTGYIAKTATNSCGKIKTRVIVENGKEKSVSQSNFDKFINNYNANCGSCLFRLSQSGNSPLFVKEYSSGQSYMIESGKGALTLKLLETTSMPTPTPAATQQNLNSIFDLSKKEAGTKIYYSDRLGVGFTYVPNQVGTSFTVKVTEIGNKIYVHGTSEKPEQGQSIEVFTKDPTLTLGEAIKNKFLQGYNSVDCFVKTYETNETRLPNYVSAGISFPPTNDPNAPWWQNADKCPQYYSETNAVQYFLMNKDVPGKFLFARIGQYSITSDGTPITTEGGFNWSHSIRILK